MADLLKVSGGAVAVIPSTTWAAPVSMATTVDRNDSSIYSWAAATSTITLPATGLAQGYLIVVGYEHENANNSRSNPQGRIVQASGTGTFVGASTGGFNRDDSEDRAYSRTWAFVDSPSASATFQFQWRRDSDTPTAGGFVRSEVQVIPLAYGDFGAYTSVAAASAGGTVPTQITGFTGTDGTNITISGDTITVTGDNKRYLILGSQYWSDMLTSSVRTQRWHHLFVDGSAVEAAKAYSYYRQTTDDQSGDLFTWLIETATASVTIDQRESRGSDYATAGGAESAGDVNGSAVGGHSFVVLELNDSAEVFCNESTTGSADLSTGSDMALATVAGQNIEDAASFTRASDTGMNATVAMDVLLGANISGKSDNIGNTTRLTAFAEFTVNGVEDIDSVAGDYMRNDQSTTGTAGWSANLLGFQALAINDDIGVSQSPLPGTEFTGTASIPANWAGFWGINLDTLVPSGPNPIVSTISGDGVFRDGETGAVITGSQFETEGAGSLVEIGSHSTYAASTTKIAQTHQLWADGSITFTVNLGTLTPGAAVYVYVTNHTSDTVNASGRLVTLHRKIALALSTSAYVDPVSSAIAAARLTGNSGAFTAGLITEDTNPLTTINIGDAEHTEIAFVFEALADSIDAGVYEIEIVESDNTEFDSGDGYPPISARVTIGASATDIDFNTSDNTPTGESFEVASEIDVEFAVSDNTPTGESFEVASDLSIDFGTSDNTPVGESFAVMSLSKATRLGLGGFSRGHFEFDAIENIEVDIDIDFSVSDNTPTGESFGIASDLDVEFSTSDNTIAGQSLTVDAQADVEFNASDNALTGELFSIESDAAFEFNVSDSVIAGPAFAVESEQNIEFNTSNNVVSGEAFSLEVESDIEFAASDNLVIGSIFEILTEAEFNFNVGEVTISGETFEIDNQFNLDFGVSTGQVNGESFVIDEQTNVEFATADNVVAGESFELINNTNIGFNTNLDTIAGLGFTQGIAVNFSTGESQIAGEVIEVDSQFEMNFAVNTSPATGETLQVDEQTDVEFDTATHTPAGETFDVTLTTEIDFASGDSEITGEPVEIISDLIIIFNTSDNAVTGESFVPSTEDNVFMGTSTEPVTGLSFEIDSQTDIELEEAPGETLGESFQIDDQVVVEFGTGDAAVSGEDFEVDHQLDVEFGTEDNVIEGLGFTVDIAVGFNVGDTIIEPLIFRIATPEADLPVGTVLIAPLCMNHNITLREPLAVAVGIPAPMKMTETF